MIGRRNTLLPQIHQSQALEAVIRVLGARCSRVSGHFRSGALTASSAWVSLWCRVSSWYCSQLLCSKGNTSLELIFFFFFLTNKNSWGSGSCPSCILRPVQNSLNAKYNFRCVDTFFKEVKPPSNTLCMFCKNELSAQELMLFVIWCTLMGVKGKEEKGRGLN